MPNKRLHYILLFFILTVCNAQERTAFSGRIVFGKLGVIDVFVINKATGLETKTDYKGDFSIAAKSGDILVVYSTKIQERQFLLRQDFFKNMPHTLSVNYRSYEMEELVIDKNNSISSESLGLVPKGQKQYTQQEKKLYTATYNEPLWKLALGLLAGSMPVDPFINAVTGRTKMVKKDLANEQKLLAIEKINTLFTEDEIISQLKVPQEYAEGFVFYAVEDAVVVAALDTKTDAELRFMLTSLALQYNQIITNE